MKVRLLFFLIINSIFFQGCCYCCFFAGGQGPISDKTYFLINNSKDTIGRYTAMEEMGNKYPYIKLDSSQVNKYFKNVYFSVPEKKYIFESGKLYPLYPLISCSIGVQKVKGYCRPTWYLKSPNNDLIFELGLYYRGFLLANVYEINDDVILKNIGRYVLCDMPRVQRKQLQKEYILRFETEILPLMKPYFD